MATSDILVFAGTTNQVTTQSLYVTQAPAGEISGTIADNYLTNKVLRQTSTLAAALAQFVANNLNVNITDVDPNPLTSTAFYNYLVQTFPTLSGNNSFTGAMFLPPSIGGVTGSSVNNAIVWSQNGFWQAGPVSGGTVFSVTAGLGLTATQNPITTQGTINLAPATSVRIGGVKPDNNTLTVAADGTLSANFPAVSYITLTRNSPTYVPTGFAAANAGGTGSRIVTIATDVRAQLAIGQNITFQNQRLNAQLYSITALAFANGFTNVTFFPGVFAIDAWGVGQPIYMAQNGPQLQNRISEIEFLNSTVSLTGFRAVVNPFGSGGGGGGSGTVVSVGLTVPTPFTVSNSPVTVAGNLQLGWGTGYIPTANLGSGVADNTTFLRGDNTWATFVGGGTVTTVSMTVPTGLQVAITTPTTTPAIALSWYGQVPVANLGTGTPNATNFLRGDGQWRPIPSTAGGTVTSVTAGAGLSGGTITVSGTINLNPASTGMIGGTRPDLSTTSVDINGVMSANLNLVNNVPLFTDTTLVTLTDGSAVSATTSFSVAGNQTATFPVGTRITFQDFNIYGTIYTVSASTFTTSTAVTFAPAIAVGDDFPLGASIYTVVNGPATAVPFNAIASSSTVTGAVANNVLTLTGSSSTTGTQVFRYATFASLAAAQASGPPMTTDGLNATWLRTPAQISFSGSNRFIYQSSQFISGYSAGAPWSARLLISGNGGGVYTPAAAQVQTITVGGNHTTSSVTAQVFAFGITGDSGGQANPFPNTRLTTIYPNFPVTGYDSTSAQFFLLFQSGGANNFYTSSDLLTFNRRSLTNANAGAFLSQGRLFTINITGTSPSTILVTRYDFPSLTNAVTNTVTTTNQFASVAFDNAGTIVFIGSGGQLYRSTNNGTSFTSSVTGSSQAWNKVAFGASIYVAIDDATSPVRIWSSSDGLTWTQRTNTINYISSGGLLRFVNTNFIYSQFVNNGSLYSAISSDGITWNALTWSTTNNFTPYDLQYNATSGLYLISSTTDTASVTTGVLSGTTMTLTSRNTGAAAVGFVQNGTNYLGTNGSSTYSSTNGTAWTLFNSSLGTVNLSIPYITTTGTTSISSIVVPVPAGLTTAATLANAVATGITSLAPANSYTAAVDASNNVVITNVNTGPPIGTPTVSVTQGVGTNNPAVLAVAGATTTAGTSPSSLTLSNVSVATNSIQLQLTGAPTITGLVYAYPCRIISQSGASAPLLMNGQAYVCDLQTSLTGTVINEFTNGNFSTFVYSFTSATAPVNTNLVYDASTATAPVIRIIPSNFNAATQAALQALTTNNYIFVGTQATTTGSYTFFFPSAANSDAQAQTIAQFFNTLEVSYTASAVANVVTITGSTQAPRATVTATATTAGSNGTNVLSDYVSAITTAGVAAYTVGTGTRTTIQFTKAANYLSGTSTATFDYGVQNLMPWPNAALSPQMVITQALNQIGYQVSFNGINYTITDIDPNSGGVLSFVINNGSGPVGTIAITQTVLSTGVAEVCVGSDTSWTPPLFAGTS